MATPAGQIITRYAGRWAIEVAIGPSINREARINHAKFRLSEAAGAAVRRG